MRKGSGARRSSNENRIEERATEILIRRGLEAMIASGRFDPSGLNDTEFSVEAARALRTLATADIQETVDHLDHLRASAKAAWAEGKAGISCLLYATWAEHWTNKCIIDMATQEDIPHTEVLQMVREVPFRAKLTWLPRLLGARPVAESHRKRLLHLMDLRNAFAHYKWPAADGDGVDSLSVQQQSVLSNMHRTVRYLKRWENDMVFGGHRAKVAKLGRKMARRPRSDRGPS